MTLFDLEPLTPAEVIRHKGRHPFHDAPLDTDPEHTCGNCWNKRDVWVYGDEDDPDQQAMMWVQVCAVFAPCSHGQVIRNGDGMLDLLNAGRLCTGDGCGCGGECCNFPTRAEARRAKAEGYDPDPPWPSPFAIVETMPACSRWVDALPEQVIEALT